MGKTNQYFFKYPSIFVYVKDLLRKMHIRRRAPLPRHSRL